MASTFSIVEGILVTSLFHDALVRGWQTFLCKGLDSKYFRLFCPHMVFVSYSSLFILQLAKNEKKNICNL